MGYQSAIGGQGPRAPLRYARMFRLRVDLKFMPRVQKTRRKVRGMLAGKMRWIRQTELLLLLRQNVELARSDAPSRRVSFQRYVSTSALLYIAQQTTRSSYWNDG